MKHAPRKRFGQHFLTDAAVLARIVGEIDPAPGDALIEIGPGLGALTRVLLPRCDSLLAIEVDRDLAARLRQWNAVRVIEADVLQVELTDVDAALGRTAPIRIVGNLPYNISSPILFHLLPWAPRVCDQHFMLQREVVQRMVAPAGGRDYGRLSVMLQWRYEMEWLLDVPPQAFDPPPAVESAVVRMRPRSHPANCDPAVLASLVRVAFSQRRKLLRHTLGHWLAERGIDGFNLQRRAEEVPVAEYEALASRVQATA